MAENYDQKYGLDSSDEKVISFHSSRRMFAIKDGRIHLAPEGATYTHAKWFQMEGWMNPENDSIMETTTRGYTDNTGIYFYKGFDFRIDEESEKEVLDNLESLVRQTGVSKERHLYGGKIKQEEGGDWPARKDYGCIKDLI